MLLKNARGERCSRGQAEIVSDLAEAGKRRARRLQFVTLGEGIIPRIQETSTLGLV
jgi:hypothetical protein